MRLPRISIARLMAVVLLIALDFAVIRSLFGNTFTAHERYYIHGLLPMTNLMAFVAMNEWRRLMRLGESRPFWTGFLASGGAALWLYSATAHLSEPNLHERYFDFVLKPLFPVLKHLDVHFPLGVDVLLILCYFLAMTLPQLVVALTGGWLFTKWRVVLVRRMPSDAGPVR